MNKPKHITVKVFIPDSIGKHLERNVNFTNDGVTLFFNAQHHLLKLSAIERCFFDFLCEHMRAIDNDVLINDEIKTKFQEHLMRLSGGKKKVTLNQLTKFVLKLNTLTLILKTQNKARYIVNPKFVFKGSAVARKKYLKKLIENRVKLKLSVAGLVNIPESQFLGVNEAIKK